MDAQRWQRIQELFHAALELPDEERKAFVAGASKEDPEIGSEVLAMLDEDKRGISQLGRGVAQIVGRALAEAETSTSFTPPERIGPYLRQEFLGRGGMGSVWKYLRVDTGQPMAIKFLPLPLSDLHYQERRRRFAEEISTLARLRHPNIVAFHDAGALDDGTQWFVMDYVEEFARGKGYTVYSRQPGRSVDAQLRHFRIVCEAVLYAHRQGVLHRDLKPSNVLVAQDESPRIVDFGIARQMQEEGEAENPTSPTSRFMSPYYAAPEWKRGGPGNVAIDVYSLGVILYEVLAGRHPYRDPAQPSAYLDDDKTRELPEMPSVIVAREAAKGARERLPRSVWTDLDKLCLTAMHPDPHERYASVESLIRDIDHYLNQEPLEAQPGLFRYRAGKFLLRHRPTVMATTAALVLVVSLVAFFMWRLARERDLAVAQAARVQHIQNFMTDLLQGGDQDAGPAANLPVTAMIDRGVQQAGMLSNEPQVQADLYQTLGSMSQKLGRFDQAESLLVKALDQQRSLGGTNRDGIESAQIALALVRAEEGRAKEAEQQVRQSLEEIRSSQTENRTLLGNAEVALGSVMIQVGEQKEAIGVLEQAIKDITAMDGTQSARLARALSFQADANIYSGNYDMADALNRRALEMDRSIYGEYHPHVSDDLGNLAQTQQTRDNYAQAEPLEREALAIVMKWYGPDHPETARKMTALASTLLNEKNVEEASDLLKRALSIQERAYGPQHPRVAYVLNSMGLLDLDQKRFADAEHDYSRIADIYRHTYGDEDYRVAVALGNLASVYQAEKRYPKAVEVLEDVVQRFSRALGASNIQTGYAQVRLGRNLLRANENAEAATHSLAGYNVLINQLSPDSAWVAGARHDLAIAYSKLGDPQKASQFAAVQSATMTNPK
jgi:eukaryotic-like serine/threonine-protein kinase